MSREGCKYRQVSYGDDDYDGNTNYDDDEYYHFYDYECQERLTNRDRLDMMMMIRRLL